jgi:Zn-dependent peptidase ImmA (M78 family)
VILKNLDVPFNSSVLDQKACEVIRLHARNESWAPALPVPVEAILERTLKLALVYDDLSSLGEGVLGSLFPAEKTVYLNENYLQQFEDFPGLQRFTIAHEIGHWKMHIDQSALGQGALFGEPDDRFVCRDGDRYIKEVAANRYAARLLMPEDLMRDILRGRDVSNRHGFRDFAADIGVSMSALHYRLDDLQVVHHWQ